MQIKYKKDVLSPANQVGKAGDIREIDDRIGRQLVKGGYAEIVEPQAKPAKTEN